MPNLVGLTAKRAQEKAHRNSIKLIVKGNGIIVSQSIPKDNKIQYGEKCYVIAQ
jgi:hypothetical protein